MKIGKIKFLLNRLITSAIVLFLLITFVFILIRIAPGDPTQKFISPKLSPELSQRVYSSFELDKPVYVQYFHFVTKILTGDFGVSYNYRQPVLKVIVNYFLFTLLLASLSIIIQLIFAFILAKYAFYNTGKFIDKVLLRSSVFIYSIPTFIIGLLLVYVFSIKFQLLPTSGLSSLYVYELNFGATIKDYISHMMLPLLTLSFPGTALFFKYLRDNLVAVSNQPFIFNLRAGGFSEEIIFKNHLLPNAIQPLISIAGIEFGLLLGGTLITEVIFALPGMGRLSVSAILNQDYPLVIGCTFIAGFMMIFANLIADLIKIKIDKRLITELIK